MNRRAARAGRQPVRMRDIAERANVSAMTVSRALRDPGKVSEETRTRVLDAIREYGYVPNRLAGNFASNRSNVVGLIVPSIKNSIFADTIQGTADVLRRAGFELMIADSGPSVATEENLIAAFVAQRLAEIVLHNTVHTDRAREMLRAAGIPVVETGDIAADPIDMTVSYSNFAAAAAMTKHLAGRGYRKIAFISLSIDENYRARERLRGHRAALAELGTAADPGLVREVGPGFTAGRDAIVSLIETRADVDAVFFAGDVLAIGAALECRRRGWAVPGRIAIATFDDLELVAQLDPPLTSLRLPRSEIGQCSAELLLDRIHGFSDGPTVRDLGFEVIERAST